jgi:hypothetical protein
MINVTEAQYFACKTTILSRHLHLTWGGSHVFTMLQRHTFLCIYDGLVEFQTLHPNK